MNIKIRNLAPSDRNAWNVLWQVYLQFYETRISAEVTESTWKRLMNDEEDPHGIGAFNEEGALIGIVHYLFHRSCWAIGDSCYLQDLYVTATNRRAGVGEALIKAVQVAADKKGASQVYWLTQHFNERARKLYDRVGELTPFIKYRGN